MRRSALKLSFFRSISNCSGLITGLIKYADGLGNHPHLVRGGGFRVLTDLNRKFESGSLVILTTGRSVISGLIFKFLKKSGYTGHRNKRFAS